VKFHLSRHWLELANQWLEVTRQFLWLGSDSTKSWFDSDSKKFLMTMTRGACDSDSTLTRRKRLGHITALYQCFSSPTKHLDTFLWINFSNNFMFNTRSNAFEASKKQHALVNHGLRSMKQFATTKMYIVDQYNVQPQNQIDCLQFQGKDNFFTRQRLRSSHY